MRRGRSLLAVLLVGVLLASFFAAAEEPACVEGYRKANGAYFNELENIRNIQKYGEAGKFVGLGGAAVCMVTRKSLTGVLLCGVAGAVIAVPSAMAENITAVQAERLKSSYMLEDFYLTFQAYFAYRSKLHTVSKEAQSFVGSVVGVDTTGVLSADAAAQLKAKTESVMEALKNLMETGVLCDGGSTPTASFKTVVELIRGKIEL
jgi:Tfp pilus assembly protein PilE